MMGITIKHRGDFYHTEQLLSRVPERRHIGIMNKFGKLGVDALMAATPKDTGATAASWSYEVVKTEFGHELVWRNSNAPYGANVAILIQYGHGIKGGGFVQGQDYINPALKPILDKLTEALWRGVIK